MKIPGGLKAIRQTFANRNYVLYVIGNLSSTTGMWVQRVAIGWLTWELTQSPAWLGGIAIAESAPTILLGFIAGTVVDRVDYFKMLRVTQSMTMIYSITLAALTFAGLTDIWVLLALTLFRGSLLAFSRPSRMTFVYNLVGRELLASAIATNSMIFNMARFIGPAIGGAILAAGNAAWTFTFGALMFFSFTVCLALIRNVAFTQRPPKETSVASETLQGFRYIMAHPGIRSQLALMTAMSILVKPLTDLFPGFAAEVFGQGPHGLAMLFVFHGVGATVGGLWLTSRASLQGLTRINLRNVIFSGFVVMLFAVTPMFWIGCALVSFIGFAFVVQGISNQTLVQSAVSPEFRGRVVSIYGLINQGVPAFGSITMGGLAEHFGLQGPVAVSAAICFALGLVMWRRRAWMAKALETDASTGGQDKGQGGNGQVDKGQGGNAGPSP
jgi:predicted MFS family arabinose efflux permease